MPRTGRRRSLTIATALLAMFAAPAAVQAATYTVKIGDGPCGSPADLMCGGLQEAADAAAAGDVFNVAQGIYGSAVFDVGGVTIKGDPTSFTVNGTITFSSGGGGVSKLQRAAINQNVGSGYGVVVSGASGVEISDCVIISNNGDAVQIHAGTTNKILRSVIATGGTGTAAVRVISADNSPATKALTLESTLVTGSAAGVSVNTGGDGLGAPVGDVNIKLRHVTAAGSTNGLVLDSNKAEGPLLGAVGVGNITAEVVDSIIHNFTAKNPYPGLLGLFVANSITDTYSRTLQSPFDTNAVFVNFVGRNFRLKAGSLAINQGGVTAGESTTDLDGQDRSTAPTDQGADEYVAPPPPVVPPPPVAPGARNDGTPPAVVITKPRANQRVRLTTRTTRTRTVTRNGKRVRVKTTTTKRNRISFAGTATDPSGVKGVVFTLQKLSSSTSSTAAGSTAPTAKCRFFNATKGLVLKTCSKPIVVLAKFAAGKWTFNVKSTIRLSVGTYRLITAGADNSGAFGNSAPTKDAVHRFTLLK